MLNSKQRAKLRGIANTMETILIIGKGGIDENVVKQADEALEKREMFKGKVLETCEINAKEAAAELTEKTHSESVQVIGQKFVLYRRNPNPKKRVIELDD